MELDVSQINWLAVIVAAVAAFLVGGLWYGLIFGKAWVRLHNYSDEQVKAMAKTQAISFTIIFAADFIGAVVLSLFIVSLETTTAAGGIVIGLLAWLGFVLVDKAKENAAHRKRLAAFGIDASYTLITLVVMGAILGGWR